jgi:hypothetical protein
VPSDRERGGLVGVKKPLVEAAPVTDPAFERTVLPVEVTGHRPQASGSAAGPLAGQAHTAMAEEPTKPATFHLPISLLQRLRATCRLKNTTMVDFVRRAVEDALERQRPTEEEIRQLLGR